MQSRIVLISDDSNFFEYLLPKLRLRKNDELYKYSYQTVLEQLHFLTASLLIINAEETEEQAIELLNLTKGTPSFVFTFEQKKDFEKRAYNSGAMFCITLSTQQEELEAKISSALNYVSSLEKNLRYRNILVEKNLIGANNDVYTDYNDIMDSQIKKIGSNSSKAVLLAISPNEKTKFLLKPNQIETIILNNIRSNDILMNFAPNKYFLLLQDTDIDTAGKIWGKIVSAVPEKIYAGITNIGLKTREQVVNEALNKLHEAINKDASVSMSLPKTNYIGANFKLYKQEFNKKLEQVIIPIFYLIQQKYSEKLYGVRIDQGVGDGYGVLYIKNKKANGEFRITSPGLAKINIDISYRLEKKQSNKQEFPASKRISLEPEELESGLVEDLLEQYITEFKQEFNNDDIE